MIKNNYKIILLYLILILMSVIKLDYQIYSPGSLLDLNDRIEIEGSYKSKGSFNLTYVKGRPGTILFTLLSYVIPSWDLIPMDNSRIDSETEEDINERNKIYLDTVNESAIIVAFKELGYSYNVKEKGIMITHIYEFANTDLKTGDVIKSIDNISVSNIEEFTNIVDTLKDNQKINLKIIRDGKEIDSFGYVQIKENKKIVGISIVNQKEIITNPEVKLNFKASEMGPSGGLMTSLKIYDMLTKDDLTKGRIISGTGTINENGLVGEISGVKYKLAGAVKSKADIFICPSENYKECMEEKNKNNYEIELLEATTFKDVLEKLK